MDFEVLYDVHMRLFGSVGFLLYRQLKGRFPPPLLDLKMGGRIGGGEELMIFRCRFFIARRLARETGTRVVLGLFMKYMEFLSKSNLNYRKELGDAGAAS